MKNSLNRLNGRLGNAEEKINELGDITTETLKIEILKEK